MSVLFWFILRANLKVHVVVRNREKVLKTGKFTLDSDFYDILTCCYFAFFPFLCPAPVYLLLLCCLCCRYRPSVAVSFVESELGFTEDEQCLKFLQDLGVVFTADGSKIDCKQSQGVVGAS